MATPTPPSRSERLYLGVAIGLGVIVVLALALMAAGGSDTSDEDRTTACQAHRADNGGQLDEGVADPCESQVYLDCVREAGDDQMDDCYMGTAMRQELPRTFECFDTYGSGSSICTEVMLNELGVDP